MNLKISRKCASFLMAILILTGCASNPIKVTEKAAVTQSLDTDFAKQVVEGIEYEVDPETFELAVKKGGYFCACFTTLPETQNRRTIG
uniref:hypothetical protein n=1 Tax=Clostridium sp. NkU-1 TaxID=1095009 RepID=UPI000A5F524F